MILLAFHYRFDDDSSRAYTVDPESFRTPSYVRTISECVHP